MIMCHILAASCTDGKHIISPFLRLLIQKVAHQSVSLVVTDPDVKKKENCSIHSGTQSIHPLVHPLRPTGSRSSRMLRVQAVRAHERTRINKDAETISHVSRRVFVRYCTACCARFGSLFKVLSRTVLFSTPDSDVYRTHSLFILEYLRTRRGLHLAPGRAGPPALPLAGR